MEEKEIVVALDIGGTKVSVILAERDQYGEIRVLGYSSKEIDNGSVRDKYMNIVKIGQTIKQAITEVSESSTYNIEAVNVSVSGSNVITTERKIVDLAVNASKTVNFDDVKRLEKKVIGIAEEDIGIRKILHVIPRKYEIEYGTEIEKGITDPIGISGNHIRAEFFIVYAQKKILDNITNALTNIGISVNAFTFEGLALVNSLLGGNKKTSNVVIIDIGGSSTDVSILINGILYGYFSLRMASKYVTNDIAHAFAIFPEVAEKLKQENGYAFLSDVKENSIIEVAVDDRKKIKEISKKDLTFVIQARLTEIFELILQEIEKIKVPFKTTYKIVLTGGGSMIMGIDALAEDIFGVSVEIVHKNKNSPMKDSFGLNNYQYSVAVGSILESLKHTDHEKKKREKNQFPKKTEPKEPIAEQKSEPLFPDATLEKAEEEKKTKHWWNKWFDEI